MATRVSFWRKVYMFFEEPKSIFSKLIHYFIILLIILSAGLMILEYGYPTVYEPYSFYLDNFEWFILGVFTVEYLLRFIGAPKKLKFIFNFYNLIDLFAIVPGYFRIAATAGLRSLRLLRLLRLARVFRVFKIFRYNTIIGKLFIFKHTVLEKIFPLLTIFTVIKLCVFFLETNGWWLKDYSLDTVFTVVGFALGIILSQKIGTAYGKFIIIEDSVTRIHGYMLSLNSVFKEFSRSGAASKVAKNWVVIFYDILLRKKKKDEFYKINTALYKEVHKVVSSAPNYAQMLQIYAKINEDASFLLNRMDALTPVTYDNLLQKATLIYSMLLIVFLPGVSGIVATAISTYVLYGMYQVTEDLDNAMTHLEDDLIIADIKDLETLAGKLV